MVRDRGEWMLWWRGGVRSGLMEKMYCMGGMRLVLLFWGDRMVGVTKVDSVLGFKASM